MWDWTNSENLTEPFTNLQLRTFESTRHIELTLLMEAILQSSPRFFLQIIQTMSYFVKITSRTFDVLNSRTFLMAARKHRQET